MYKIPHFVGDALSSVNKWSRQYRVMPIKDGIKAVSEIKEFDENAKIVMASSSGTKENLKKAIKAGAFEFIQKPWEQEQINKIVNNFLKEGE